jgi:hypothetical protein
MKQKGFHQRNQKEPEESKVNRLFNKKLIQKIYSVSRSLQFFLILAVKPFLFHISRQLERLATCWYESERVSSRKSKRAGGIEG